MLKDILANTFISKLALTIAASAIIGGGTVVLTNQSRIAVLESTVSSEDTRIDHRLERIENKIDLLQSTVSTK
jgi:hypothetical protein